MSDTQIYKDMLARLTQDWEVMADKPEETPESALRALWYVAAGQPKSVESALVGELPGLTPEFELQLRELVGKRLKGIPLAHLSGRQQFMDVELLAGREALVPRKETELLGNAALEILKNIADVEAAPRVIDVCTGAGNLAVAFAMHVPQAKVYAADLSGDAVGLAKRNVEFVGAGDRVKVQEGDLLAPYDGDIFHGSVDLLTCNPPYISSAKVDTMHEEISNYEPRLAFDGGPFGIKILQRLMQEAPRFLKTGGWLAFEVGLGQGPAILQRLRNNKNFDELRTVEDATGEVRAIMARRSNP